MPTANHLAEWLGRLVRIPSVNPAQAGPRAGVTGEAAMGEAVAAWFRELSGEVHIQQVSPGRPNVYGIWRGTSDRWAGVDVHMDTVGVEQMTEEPFSGRIADGRVYGRGSVDTKATLAVVLALLEAMGKRDARPVPNLLIAATSDEEVTATGAPAFAQWLRDRNLRLDQLAIAEPTHCGPIIAHKGLIRLVFRVRGVPTHSSQPHLGKNAITGAARLVLALDEEHQRLQAAGGKTAVGPGTLTVTLVEGGTGANVVPDCCTFTVDRRVAPGEDLDEIEAGILQLARDHCPLPFDVERPLAIQPFYQDPEAPWIQQLAEWSGRPASVVPYGTNAWAYGDIAVERAVLGPGSIDQAHGTTEWVEITELERLANLYTQWWGLPEEI